MPLQLNSISAFSSACRKTRQKRSLSVIPSKNRWWSRNTLSHEAASRLRNGSLHTEKCSSPAVRHSTVILPSYAQEIVNPPFHVSRCLTVPPTPGKHHPPLPGDKGKTFHNKLPSSMFPFPEFLFPSFFASHFPCVQLPVFSPIQ